MTTDSKLAINGGKKTINVPFKRYNSMGPEEAEAAAAVVRSGVLSQFIGCWDPDFFGGPKVQEFERDCEAYFGVKHAVTVNSWTSGLVAAVGAVGIEPGDEVIVTPWTMAASATAILHWNAIPVFADIEPQTFNIDPQSIVNNITPQTKAILAVDIFGQSCDIDAIMGIAEQYGLKVIGDTAQAPGTFNKGRVTGTMAHVGGYSLNYHKHIHTGEGGILVTNDDGIAERLQLIRNHAEAVVAGKGVDDLCNMVGHNFRLGEIEAAIGIEQLKKLRHLVETRQKAAQMLTEGLTGLRGLRLPIVKEDCTHAYYMYPMILDLELLETSREWILSALEAEGVQGLAAGYTNIHLLPIYQRKIAYGRNGFPWTADFCKRNVNYAKGICPIAEDLHERTYLGFEMCMHDLSGSEIDLLVAAFQKVWSSLEK